MWQGYGRGNPVFPGQQNYGYNGGTFPEDSTVALKKKIADLETEISSWREKFNKAETELALLKSSQLKSSDECTFAKTGPQGFYCQPWWHCKTCQLVPENGGRGMCTPCAIACHGGHEITRETKDVVAVCDCSEQQNRCRLHNRNQPNVSTTTTSSSSSEVVRFVEYKIMDGPMEARSCLLPRSWITRGPGLVVRQAPATSPVYFAWSAYSPDGGLTQIEFFPQYPFISGMRESAYRTAMIAGPQIAAQAASAWPDGSFYMGMEVRPLMENVKQFIETMLLPRVRQGIAYKIVSYKDLPKLIEGQTGPSYAGGRRALAGMTRIQYNVSGHSVEEDVVVSLTYDFNAQLGQTYWGTNHCYAVRAPLGKLDLEWKTFNFINDSIRDNPAFLQQIRNLSNQLVAGQLEATRQVGIRSQIIANTQREIGQIITDTYNRRQAVQDRLSHQWSQVIRGVESYASPLGSVELPSGYRNGYYNTSTGEYIMTDNTLFNPNTDLHNYPGNWERLTKVDIH